MIFFKASGMIMQLVHLTDDDLKEFYPRNKAQ